MHTIEINQPSRAQIRRLSKGGKIRIRKGTGFQLNVHPETYNIVARAFNRNKGLEFGLSQEELRANNIEVPVQNLQQVDSTGTPLPTNVAAGPTPMQRLPIASPPPPAPHMLGMGIFGPKFDRFLKKHHMKKVAYIAGDIAKPFAKLGANYAIGSATTAGIAAAPEFAVPIGMAGMAASALTRDYLDNPGKYQGTSGNRNQYKHNDLASQVEQSKHFNMMNNALGTNFDYLGKAGLHKAVADTASSKMIEDSINARKPKDIEGSGFHYHTPHAHLHRLDRTVSGRGAPVVNHALVSQPMNENFNMNHHLPPSFQIHNASDHIHGSGFKKSDWKDTWTKEDEEKYGKLEDYEGYTSEEEEEEPEYDSDTDFKHQHPETQKMIIAEEAKQAKELRDRKKLMKERTKRPERQSEVISMGNNPHNYFQRTGFSPSVMIPPSYLSQADDADFIRQQTKAPKKGKGLYASGRSGKGLYM